jgi:hypothetical protein
MAWQTRSRLPESVRDLDRERVAVLVSTNVNVTEAAKKLRVPSVDLRRLFYAVPELVELAIDKEERRLDRAEAILERELASEDPRYSAAAAYFVLKQSKRASERGWRQPNVEVVVNSGPSRVLNVRWGDGTLVTKMEVPGNVYIAPPVIEHDRGEPPPAEAAE